MGEKEEANNVAKENVGEEVVTIDKILKNALVYLPLLVIIIVILGLIKQLLFYWNFNLPIYYFLNTSEIILLISEDLFFMSITFIILFNVASRFKKYSDNVINSTKQKAKLFENKLDELKGKVLTYNEESSAIQKEYSDLGKEFLEHNEEFLELEKNVKKDEKEYSRFIELFQRRAEISFRIDKLNDLIIERGFALDRADKEISSVKKTARKYIIKFILFLLISLCFFAAWSLLILTFFNTKIYSLKLTLLPVIALPLFFPLPKFFKDLLGKYFRQNIFILSFIIIFLISAVMIKASYDIVSVEYGKYTGTTIITSDTSQHYISNDTAFFIGKTERYIFFYNKNQQSTTIIPADQITKMVIKSK